MLALRAKTEVGWVVVHAPSLSEFLFFRYLKYTQNAHLLRVNRTFSRIFALLCDTIRFLHLALNCISFWQHIRVPRDFALPAKSHKVGLLTQHVANAPYRLSSSMLVFDQCETHILIPIFTKPDTWRYGNLSLGKQ